MLFKDVLIIMKVTKSQGQYVSCPLCVEGVHEQFWIFPTHLSFVERTGHAMRGNTTTVLVFMSKLNNAMCFVCIFVRVVSVCAYMCKCVYEHVHACIR